MGQGAPRSPLTQKLLMQTRWVYRETQPHEALPQALLRRTFPFPGQGGPKLVQLQNSDWFVPDNRLDDGPSRFGSILVSSHPRSLIKHCPPVLLPQLLFAQPSLRLSDIRPLCCQQNKVFGSVVAE